MDAKTTAAMRRLVAEGSIRRGGRFLWICPICCARVATGADLLSVTRAGRNHCLVHTGSPETTGRPTRSRTAEGLPPRHVVGA